MSELLMKACEECVADAGREDDTLVHRLHDYIAQHYESQGKPWSYDLIDKLIEDWKNPEFRKLDGIYFRIYRNDKWQNICWSDLTEDEMNQMMEGRTEEWLKSMCKMLGQTIRNIGDQCDIRLDEEEDVDG